MKFLRMLIVAALVATGGALGTAGTADAAAGLPMASPMSTMAAPAPDATIEKAYYVTRCFWRYGRRWCRTFWHRPYYRHYYYHRYYWHPYRHYWHRRYWHRHYWHRYYW